MVSRVSLQNIANADWSKQYLDSNGEVKNKTCRFDFLGIGPKIIKLLRTFSIFEKFFPKPDIVQGVEAVKREIRDLLIKGDTNADDAVITGAVKKVNEITYKILKIDAININALKAALKDFLNTNKDLSKATPVPETQVAETPVTETPVAETPAEPARVEILPDDAEQTPVQEEPKAPTDEGLSLGLGKPVEGDIYDDISSIPLSPKALHFDMFEQNTPADELVAEEVAVPPQEVIAKEREDAKKDVAKDTQKASARTEGNKRKKQEEKAKAPVQAAKPKQAVAPKKGHANKKTKHN